MVMTPVNIKILSYLRLISLLIIAMILKIHLLFFSRQIRSSAHHSTLTNLSQSILYGEKSLELQIASYHISNGRYDLVKGKESR